MELVGVERGVETLYYVTVLSNLVRGYDKYARTYDKALIPESSYPGRFFLIPLSELSVGVAKAGHLPSKTGLAGDRLIALETRVAASELRPNLRTGLGRYVERGSIRVERIHRVDPSGAIVPAVIEEVLAESLSLHAPTLAPYGALAPRSVSILPVAQACPARCPFCFSKASVSSEIASGTVDWTRWKRILAEGRRRGVRRAVITGGGEPTMLPPDELMRLIRETAAAVPKTVLITNGFRWGRRSDEDRLAALLGLQQAGLTVLSISRHHVDRDRNAALMGLDTGSERIAETWSRHRDRLPGLTLRWICVLQRGGVGDRESLERYLDWSAENGVAEICFKELYVSSSIESEYHDRTANEWSGRHQVPLQLVLDLARDAAWSLQETLPWGAPVFAGRWKGFPLRVAAYTEPSLLWERTHGQCRSWNLMADGRCLASLEDRRSEVQVP